MFRKKTERLPGFSSVPGYYIRKKGIEQNADSWNNSIGRDGQVGGQSTPPLHPSLRQVCSLEGESPPSAGLPARMTRSEICIDESLTDATTGVTTAARVDTSLHSHSRRGSLVRGAVGGGVVSGTGATRPYLTHGDTPYSGRPSFVEDLSHHANMSYPANSSSLPREASIRSVSSSKYASNIILSRYQSSHPPPPDVVPHHEQLQHPTSRRAINTVNNQPQQHELSTGPPIRFHRVATNPALLRMHSPDDVDLSASPPNCPDGIVGLNMPSGHFPTAQHHHNYAASASLDRRSGTAGPVARRVELVSPRSEYHSRPLTMVHQTTASGSQEGRISRGAPPRVDQLSTEELDRILDNLQSGQPLSIKKRTQSLDLLNMQNRLPSKFVEFERYLDEKFQDDDPQPGLPPGPAGTRGEMSNSLSPTGLSQVAAVGKSPFPSSNSGGTRSRFFPLTRQYNKRQQAVVSPSNGPPPLSPYSRAKLGKSPQQESSQQSVPYTTSPSSSSSCTPQGSRRLVKVSMSSSTTINNANLLKSSPRIAPNTSSTSSSSTAMFPEHFVPSYCVPLRFPSGVPGMSVEANCTTIDCNEGGSGVEWLLSPLSNLATSGPCSGSPVMLHVQSTASSSSSSQLTASAQLLPPPPPGGVGEMLAFPRSPSGGSSSSGDSSHSGDGLVFLCGGKNNSSNNDVAALVEAMGPGAHLMQLPELLWPDEDALYTQIKPLLEVDLELYLGPGCQDTGNACERTARHQRGHQYVNELSEVLALAVPHPSLPFAWRCYASSATGVIYYHFLLGHCQRHHPNLWFHIPPQMPSSFTDTATNSLLESLVHLKERVSPVEIAEPVKRFFNAAPESESPLFHIHLKCKSLKDLNLILSQVNLLAYESMQSILIAYETYRAALVRLMLMKKPPNSG